MSLSDSTTSFFKKCPRCLGTGYVDWDDIERLGQESSWEPGSCAYCNGTGKVDHMIEEKVPVNASYLVIDLPEAERKRITDGDPEAIERAKEMEKRCYK